MTLVSDILRGLCGRAVWGRAARKLGVTCVLISPLGLSAVVNALTLGPGDVTVSTVGTGTAIDVNPGGVGIIPLNPTMTTTVNIEIEFGDRIVLDNPGLGPPPFPGFPPPANPWVVTVTYATTGDNPGVFWPLEDDDLRFTGLDGGAPDVDVLASNINVQGVDIAGGVLTHTFNISQAQAGLAPGLGFLDFHMLDLQMNLGDNATLELERVLIEPSHPEPLVSNGAVPEPLTATLGAMGLGLLSASMRRRRMA